MMIPIYFSTVVTGLIILILLYPVLLFIRSPRKKKDLLNDIKYELRYAHIGFKSIIEDIVMIRRSRVDLVPKTDHVIVITGGLRGIGLEVIRMLLECDTMVVVGCRETENGEHFANKMRMEGTHAGKLDFKKLDTSSLESVRKFAESVKKDYPKINVLINNAAVMYVPYSKTADGIESQLATNYLGHFLLTHLLLDTLAATGTEEEPSRIIHVTSVAHEVGVIDFEDINSERSYHPFKAYSQSKLAILLFSIYLNGLVKERDHHIESYAVHPGVVNTDLFNETLVKKISPWLLGILFKPPDKGAIPIVFCAISPLAKDLGGCYISNCVKKETSGTTDTEDLQERLFNFTMNMLKINEFGKV